MQKTNKQFHKIRLLSLTSFCIDSLLIITKNITGRLWAWLYVKLPLWHSAYHMNTCLERRSAPQHQSWSEMITSCQAFHCYCPLNYYCLLVVCIIQYLIQYVWKQNKELCAIFTTIIPSRVLSVFAARCILYKEWTSSSDTVKASFSQQLSQIKKMDCHKALREL